MAEYRPHVGKVVCEISPKFQRSNGIFFGSNPLKHTISVVFLQTSTTGLLIAFLHAILAPLGVTTIFSQLLAGLIMGPAILGDIEVVGKYLFPPKTFYVNDTIALFGCTMYLFLIGIKIDLSNVVKALKESKRSWAIGACSFMLPLMLSISAALFLRSMMSSSNQKLHSSIVSIAFIFSTSSFHVTANHLADLKLLNSELGRIGVSSTIVSGVLSTTLITGVLSSSEKKHGDHNNSYNMMMISAIALVIFIVYVLRPIMFWMIRQTPKGKPMKESYILYVFLMLFGNTLMGEVIGEHFVFGPIVMGLAVPDGPPLATALVEKIDAIISSMFLPLYFLFCGSKFKISLMDTQNFALVQLVALICFLAKIVGAMLPSLFYKIPLVDALCLGFLVSAHGITELIYLQTSLHLGIIDEESYGSVVIGLLWSAGVSTPVVKFLYDPSKRYLAVSRRRNIEHAFPNTELQLMACIHCEENSLSIINILEMSNPTQESPICLYVMHLVQLKGRTTPVFIDHQQVKKNNNSETSYSSKSECMINAFRSYEKQNSGKLVTKLFTSISPYETMHDEICLEIVEKRVSMLIVPFHRQWISTEITESTQPIRALNRHLLRIAPCSVGVLIERGPLNRNSAITCLSYYSVGVVFIEGPDDREALVYAMRMANGPNVRVTVVRLVEPHKKNRTLISRDYDGKLIHQFKFEYVHIKRHEYREEIVRDGVDVINVVKSLDGCFDLVLVGRSHANESTSLFSGLAEWNEYPELGYVGDMLVSSHSSFVGSVLVVQQQRLGAANNHDEHLDTSSHSMKSGQSGV
ncbi:hypothetical protein Lal_00030959 [Lupinus albus]|uniref:Putative cation/H+ exchanger n=1 Tax=Lupinus albus TaxID=3870 RepID=A0A6A5LVK4_LUPAL|nr:putative cation/H+ exchanger [Lupinus albus]KAF1863843.1 hypothetical protein Lal_00030959 [Lupinus albus]